MKFFRRRRPSWKTAVGITKVKRDIARATGIPTTKQGRRRKALNLATHGAYGRYERTRAAVNRPYKMMKRPPTPMGCMVWLAAMMLLTALLLFLLL